MNPGTLYILASPSGGGKSSLIKALVESIPNLQVSISYTTRPMRPREQAGVDYHFVNQDEFDRLHTAGTFLEHATVYGHCYGTSRPWVLENLKNGADVILEIDWQGARQVARLLPDSVSIFILPPSRGALERRLHSRGQDGDEVIARRMCNAVNEVSHYTEFDYLVLNEEFSAALDDLRAIIRAQRLRREMQVARLAALLADLFA